MTSTDIKQQAILKDLGKSLEKFEPKGGLHRFKNTAIYHSLKHSYEVYLEKVTKQQCPGEKE